MKLYNIDNMKSDCHDTFDQEQVTGSHIQSQNEQQAREKVNEDGEYMRLKSIDFLLGIGFSIVGSIIFAF